MMLRNTFRTFAAVSTVALFAMGVRAQPVSTVITHGYSFDGEKGAWIEGMADAIVARAGAGSVFRYRQDSGAWQHVSGNLDASEPVVLIFRWLNDFDKPGVNLGFAEAAGDALYAAVRAARFVDGNNEPMAGIDLVDGRALHFISHSRGTCVNSEAVRRFAAAAIVVDHVTTFDPHPMNGTLDPPLNFDWGDPTPMKWSNVTWADNYWRADGGFVNAFDFDGIPIENALNIELPEQELECCGYQYSHSDTHLWHHGTIDLAPNPCDGEVCITDEMRARWWNDNLPYETSGFYYSIIGGGAGERPSQPSGADPGEFPALFNGSFDNEMHAGWLFHGGHLDATIATESGESFLRLGAGSGVSAAHNRFLLNTTHASLQFDARVIQADPDDRLEILLVDPAGTETTLATLTMESAGPWQRDIDAPIGAHIPRNERYTLMARIVATGSQNAIVGIDQLSLVDGPVSDIATLTDVTVLEGTHVSGTVDELLASDDAYFATTHRITGEAAEAHRLQYLLEAETDFTAGNQLTITVEGKTGDPAAVVTLFLRDWDGGFDAIAQFGQGLSDTTEVTVIGDAARYIRGDGRVELLVKKHIVLPSALAGTPSFDDLIEIRVD